MKSEYIAVLVICLTIITVFVSGCSEPGANSVNKSINNTTVIPTAYTNTPTSIPYFDTSRPIITRNGTSMLFNIDNLSWYQYGVTLQINNETRHKKLDVDYTRGWMMVADGVNFTTRIHVWNVWPDDNNASSYSIYVADLGGNRIQIEGSSGSNIQEGIKVYGSIGLPDAKGSMDGIISTRFDADTDSTMKQKGFETIPYNGELYNCTVYEVHADNDTFMVWHNTSVPIPLKIVADYKNPEKYLYYFGSWYRVSTVSNQYTYDLLDWGTTKENMPFPK